jgi:hypothetical protein
MEPQTSTPVEPQGTGYHASVEDFRRTLVKAHLTWAHVADRYNGAIARHAAGNKGSRAEQDAWGASVMAYNYAYTLAAVIKLAEREFGPEVAHALAREADEILTNGDDEPGRNADVWPAAEDSSTVQPAAQCDGQLDLPGTA